MKLADLRKVAIREQLKIRFSLQNGMECILNERGVAQVPALRGVPQFNLEQELASASEFLLEPAATGRRNPERPRRVTREEMTSLAGEAPGGTAAATEHEDD